MNQPSRIPPVGDQIPRRGSRFGRALAEWAMILSGWRVTGQFPNLPQFVVIVAPHNTGWDLPLAMASVFALGIDYRWMGKHTLFRGPLGVLLTWMGGIPIDRRAPQGTVQQIVTHFAHNEQFILGLAPEGTRRQVDQWKTGFYHIAVGAQVPIVPVVNDYRNRALHICPAFTPTGSLEHDLPHIRAYFANVA